ncbi:hypothetical protein Agub_g9903 [Astrephomene gubernaculifera]|uniref:CBM20 domain-containing protein n=1 Tax=Astrephomene gubernaculifera TaxID=47775 RepID=A0AAD3HPI7_9CHLO|nr:hypothetical protein Agub_g9903 [Astrephomene gubernaculifera]
MALSTCVGHQPLARKGSGSIPPRPFSHTLLLRPVTLLESSTSRPMGALGGPRCHGLQPKLQVLASKMELSVVEPRETAVCRVGSVRYRFVVPQYVTTYGQSLRVVGSLPELGAWDPHHAPVMAWSDGHQWSLDCALPQQSFEFKIIVFEGHGLRWESGSNRVVLAGGEGGDVPVEIVVWLTCHFNATTATQMQLAVPRAQVEDAYETGKATLEFLRRRKAKMGQDSEQTASASERQRQAAELLRLSEAVVEQQGTVLQLGDLLAEGGGSNGNGGSSGGSSSSQGRLHGGNGGQAAAEGEAEEDEAMLLLAIESVRLPPPLRRISFANVVQSWSSTGSPALESGLSPGGSGDHAQAEAGVAASLPGANPALNPFLLGELDNRAEELMSAAGELLRASSQLPLNGAPASASPTPASATGPPGSPTAASSASASAAASSQEWADLAEEASQVAGVMAALGAGQAATQLQGLASVGSALAGSGGGGGGGGNGAGVAAAVEGHQDASDAAEADKAEEVAAAAEAADAVRGWRLGLEDREGEAGDAGVHAVQVPQMGGELQEVLPPAAAAHGRLPEEGVVAGTPATTSSAACSTSVVVTIEARSMEDSAEPASYHSSYSASSVSDSASFLVDPAAAMERLETPSEMLATTAADVAQSAAALEGAAAAAVHVSAGPSEAGGAEGDGLGYGREEDEHVSGSDPAQVQAPSGDSGEGHWGLPKLMSQLRAFLDSLFL